MELPPPLQETPRQTSFWPWPTPTLDALAEAAAQRLQKEFPYQSSSTKPRSPPKIERVPEPHHGLRELMTSTMKDVKQKEGMLRQRLRDRRQRWLKETQGRKREAEEDQETLRTWHRLQLLRQVYKNQQRLVHQLPGPEGPLPVVEICTPESWKD